MPLASLESLAVPVMSHPVDDVGALTKLLKFTDKTGGETVVHFIKQ